MTTTPRSEVGEYGRCGRACPAVASWPQAIRGQQEVLAMYVVAQHRFTDPQVALARGEKLIKNEDAPAGVKGLQFYPSQDRSAATCLWESDSVEGVQEYVDSTLGDSSQN